MALIRLLPEETAAAADQFRQFVNVVVANHDNMAVRGLPSQYAMREFKHPIFNARLSAGQADTIRGVFYSIELKSIFVIPRFRNNGVCEHALVVLEQEADKHFRALLLENVVNVGLRKKLQSRGKYLVVDRGMGSLSYQYVPLSLTATPKC